MFFKLPQFKRIVLLLCMIASSVVFSQQIGVIGNGSYISDNDATPSTTNHTDFDTSTTRTFYVDNIQGSGNTTLSVTSIALSNTTDFTISSPLSDNTITKNQSPVPFSITLTNASCGTYTSTVTIVSSNASNDGGDNAWVYTISATSNSEIDIVDAGANAINDGSTNSPSGTNSTEFGNVGVGSSSGAVTYTIENNGNCDLNLDGTPIVNLSNTTDFTVDYSSTSSTVSPGGSTTFTIVFNPASAATLTSTVTIDNNDSNEDPYTFTVQGTGTVPSPEIDVEDDANNVVSDGSIDSPAAANNTAFGSTDGLTPLSQIFRIENNGSLQLDISSITSSNPDFDISVAPASSVAVSSFTEFTITFTPTAVGTISSTITINNNDSAPEDEYTFTVQGEGTAAPPEYTAYYENFDDDNGGWSIITSTADTWLWTSSFPNTVTELNEGGFWRNSSYDNYASSTNIVVESPSYDLTGLENLKVSLDVKYKTENNFDGMRIMYSVSGGTYSLLGSSGSGTNWYEDSVSTFGTDGWNDDSHTANTSFDHSKFINASITISDATFSNQSDVKFRIEFSSDGGTEDDGVAFDNFRIQGDPITALSDASVGPADITTNLRLWLKTNEGIATTDGNPITNWEDQAYATTLDKEDAYASTTLAPTYRENGTRNMNFNPALDFDNNNVEYMNGKGGFYSTDYFAVFRSDDTVDTQTGDFSPGRQFAVGARYSNDNFHEDPSGLGMGSSTARYPDEILAHNVNSFPNASDSEPTDDSYGRAYTTTTDTFSNHVLIVNVKSNPGRTATEIYKNGKKVDNTTGKSGNGSDLNFKEFQNTPFLVGTGRSGLAGRTTSQLNGMLTEIVSYSSPNSVINQQKIQSYLAIKYGVTLQDAASTLLDHRLNDVDYIDSQGKTIWDTSANTGYNYDVAGIGRDDQSILDQRQSRSQNDEVDGVGPTSGFLTMSLTDTFNTNKENIAATTTLNDREFLVWGNNNADLDDPALSITVDMSEDIGDIALETEVSFESMTRVWKVVETGQGAAGTFDVPSVEVSIPTSVVRTATPPDGRYLMFISATGVFDPTADYRVMRESGGRLYADYDFDNTEYITFGWAPEREFKRSIYFDPVDTHYIDMEDALDINPDGNGFTVSAWVNRRTNSNNKSILSKRNASFSEGYDLKINNVGKAEMTWKNGGAQTIISDVEIPENEWHHIAVIYDGGTTTMYIDGVSDAEDNSLTAPSTTGTSQSFFVAAAVKGAPEAHFHGNIDEVRVWDIALSLDQLKYIMNQEIEENSTFVGGKIIPNTITKNEVGVIDWDKLAGYYPMSVYTYTNTKDASGKGNQGALKNLQTVDWQTAPLPYISEQDGDWNLSSSWENGDKQTIPGSNSIADASITVDWNIVQSSHNIDVEQDIKLLGLMSESTALITDEEITDSELTIGSDGNDYELNVSHYLKLDGKIDLENESQFIQGEGSDLDITSKGYLERDQQGTANSYTYNYWSLPVSKRDITANNVAAKSGDVLRDGTTSSTPSALDFDPVSTSAVDPYYADGALEDPRKIATYWMWRFVNNQTNDYANWEWVGNYYDIGVTEGYTMKGVSGSSEIVEEQNYVFRGKPNNVLNGDTEIIHTSFDANFDVNGNPKISLTGNPFPSALDANEFIDDNINSTNGQIYFWEHWGGGTHEWQQYQGGYSIYTKTGGVLAVSHPDVSQIDERDSIYNPMEPNKVLRKTPKRYIPVGQGFYVIQKHDYDSVNNIPSNPVAGNVIFKNSQRFFATEDSGNSVFTKGTSSKEKKVEEENSRRITTDDAIQRIRLGLVAPDGFRRQIMVGFLEGATDGVDHGYEGIAGDYLKNDGFFIQNNIYYVIQAFGEFRKEREIPLSIFIDKEGEGGIQKFFIDGLENIDDSVDFYIKDNYNQGQTHDIKNSVFEIELKPGEHKDRFALVFEPRLLRVDEISVVEEGFKIFINNDLSEINIIKIADIDIKRAIIINTLGQTIKTWNKGLEERESRLPVNVSTGVYILNLETEEGIITRKLLIE